MPFSIALHQYIDRIVLIGPHTDNVRQLLEVPLRYLKARQGIHAANAYPLIFDKLIAMWGAEYIQQVFDDVSEMERPCRLISEEVFRVMMSDLENAMDAIRTLDGSVDPWLESRHSYATLQTILQIDKSIEGMMKSSQLKGPVMRTCMTVKQRFYREHHADFSWKL